MSPGAPDDLYCFFLSKCSYHVLYERYSSSDGNSRKSYKEALTGFKEDSLWSKPAHKVDHHPGDLIIGNKSVNLPDRTKKQVTDLSADKKCFSLEKVQSSSHLNPQQTKKHERPWGQYKNVTREEDLHVSSGFLHGVRDTVNRCSRDLHENNPIFPESQTWRKVAARNRKIASSSFIEQRPDIGNQSWKWDVWT